jgi:uncharacterized NAD(P)/FAD-binding protein YdhS
MRSRTIAIIGAGFSGTVLAANLLRRLGNEPVSILLIEPREEVGRGVAYQRAEHPHLLNVPAVRMSADSDEPLQFVRFAQQRDPQCDPLQFLPRSLYGDYLQQVLSRAIDAALPPIRFERIRATALSLHPTQPAGPYVIALSNEQRLLADDVVLACGYPPAEPASIAVGVAGHAAYVCDPGNRPALRRPSETVLLIGTGLTMADAAVAAADLNPNVRIHAVSRHGRLPAKQGEGSGTAGRVESLNARLGATPVGARAALRSFRCFLRDVRAAGAGWYDAMNLIRHDAPQIWARMPATERSRFLRHLRSRWDIHRHRAPPAIHARLEALRNAGQLHVHAGDLQPLTAQGDRIEVSWRRRGSQQIERVTADQVINCAGADGRLSRTRDPLLQSLLADGVALPDSLGLGLATDDDGALLDRNGQRMQRLFYVGPMLRARHWEATAVGELRVHVERLAATLTSSQAAAAGTTSHSKNCTSLQL